LATEGRWRRLPGARWVVVFALGSCLSFAPVRAREEPAGATPAVRAFETTVLPGEQALAARWTLPAGPPRGLALLQHGFTRRCANLAGTMHHWAQAGLAVLCVEVSGVPGAEWLPGELADALADDRLDLPTGEPLPRRIVVAGHSAGATFAARVGARLAERAPERLAGAVLLDPVASPGLTEALDALSAGGARPVLAALAEPGPCNAEGSVLSILRSLRLRRLDRGATGFVGVHLGVRATHLDAEGEDTSSLAVRVCGQGWPQAPRVQALRALGAHWALEMLGGASDPGAGAPARARDAPMTPTQVRAIE
jgi:pimeloyl-ACP methyl ester carboxylesterase